MIFAIVLSFNLLDQCLIMQNIGVTHVCFTQTCKTVLQKAETYLDIFKY